MIVTMFLQFISIFLLFSYSGSREALICSKFCSESCCEVNRNEFMCCPFVNGVCCSDLKHCCPQGTECDLVTGNCSTIAPSAVSLPKLLRPPLPRNTTPTRETLLRYVLCPNRKSTCVDNTTCCPMALEQWGCCPTPEAVCCSDGLHCCPGGHVCDSVHGSCKPVISLKDSSESVRLTLQSFKISQIRFGGNGSTNTKSVVASNVICPDPRFECPSGTTCCEDLSGDWACCPLFEAVCCSDKEHCCPLGYWCDLQAQQCKNSKVSRNIPEEPNTKIICPNQKSACFNNATCCEVDGHWSCCPTSEGVCCPNGQGCCSKGSDCDSVSHQCVNQSAALPNPVTDTNLITWSSKLNAIHAREDFTPESSPSNQLCPGGRSQCRNGTTCCPLTQGKWACCPIPLAVCCADGRHCCPSGSICDPLTFSCKRRLIESVTVHGFAISPLPSSTKDHVCPDFMSRCSGNKTCCPSRYSTWDCCPLDNGVCCSDRLHCCPMNTTCNVASGQCIHQNEFDTKLAGVIPGFSVTKKFNNRRQTHYRISFAPFLIPSRVLGMKSESFLPHSLLSRFAPRKSMVSKPAKQNLLLQIGYHRRLKRIRHTVCSDSLHYCSSSEQCCSSTLYGFTCVPKEASCCERGDTYCEDSMKCTADGMLCF